MPLRVLAAGGSKEEKDRVEAAVRGVFASRSSETWFVSLVKVREQWSVTLDGPGLRAVTLLTAESRIREEIGAALRGGSPGGPLEAPSPASSPAAAPAPAAPAPVTPPRVPAPAAAPGRSPTVLRPPTAATRPAPAPPPPAAPRAPSPPVSSGSSRSTPAAQPSRPAARPSAFGGPSGERRDPQSCTQCGDGFIVVYMADDPDEALETVAVACPHCWHINHAMLPATIAYNNEYRAEKP
jgi:hypothetical protein